MDEEGGSLVKVPPETLKKRMEFCKLSVIGRVILGKGEEVWTTKKLREKLNEVWGFSSSWRLISLGKGYFHLLFSSQEEYEKVWKRGVIQLKPGILRLQKFLFGFDPTKEKSTHAQVWFRFFNLPWCLWDSSILAALARKIGTPIRFDSNTINGDFGHYARVLIEVDLSKSLKSVLHLDCGNNIYDIKVTPENIPLFCKACSNIGHSSMECRMLKKKGDNGIPTAEKHTESKTTRQVNLAIEERVETHRKQKQGRNYSSPQVNNGLDESSKEEMVPDFGNQSLGVSATQSSKDFHTSNKFSVLEDYNDMEMENGNKENQNSGIDEAKGDDLVQNVPLSKGDVNHTLQNIRRWAEQEKRNIAQSAVPRRHDENITPKAPKRWSDMLDEEEDGETKETKEVTASPEKYDILCFERNGELTEIQVSTGKVRITPISKEGTK